MTLHWPQITFVVLCVLFDIQHIAHDGEPRDDTYSASNALLGTVIMAWLLWCGGFFG